MILTKYTVLHALACVVLCLLPFVSNAQVSEDVVITQNITGTDLTSPTVPANFTTTPITDSQIDLDWDASFDNVSVGGYQIFRDAAQIATTTLTSYSDTGLASSTLYTYYIIAFDTSFNYASQTASTSATTFAPTPSPSVTPTATSSNTSGYRIQDIEILDIDETASENAIDLSFNTNVHTKATIRWGRTKDYEGGFIASDRFTRSHGTTIDGLAQGTVYEIEIFLTDRSSRKELRYTQQITTDAGPDSVPPANVTGLTVSEHSQGAVLSWVNPDVSDFSHVRVLSSDRFYPTHIADGYLVYDGQGQEVVDTRAIPMNSKRYYTVFVYDSSGNTSSGAVTFWIRGKAQVVIPVDPIATTSVSTVPQILFSDIEFMQNGIQILPEGDTVTLAGADNTIISIPYELLPEHLKTVVVTLTHPNDSTKAFSFLLRIDQQKTSYQTEIGPLLEPGVYRATAEVFNFNTQELYAVSGFAEVTESAQRVKSGNGDTTQSWAQIMMKYWYIFLILLLLLLALLVYRLVYDRQHEDSAL
jgi:hypothetical protein